MKKKVITLKLWCGRVSYWWDISKPWAGFELAASRADAIRRAENRFGPCIILDHLPESA